MRKTLSASLFMVLGVGLGMSISVFANQRSFPDVKTNDWFYQDVMNMVDWNVIQGNSDGTFAPSKNVNRAELSAMWNRYETHLEDKFVTKEYLEELLEKQSVSTTTTDSVKTDSVAEEVKKEETTVNSDEDLAQGDKISIDGFEYTILKVYKNDYVGTKDNKQKPDNGKFVIVEMVAKNVSNETGYMGKFLLLGNNTQYDYSTSVAVYGEHNFMYPSRDNTVFEVGSSLKTFVGFDADDLNSYTLQVKKWGFGDEKVRVKIDKFAPTPKQ